MSYLPFKAGDASGDGCERLSGIIDRIVYTNDEGTWGVARLRPEGGGQLITIAGQLYGVTEGQDVVLFGRWEEHRKYGRQFTVDDVAVEAPTSLRGMVKFLGGGNLPGIGEKLAKRIVSHFGEQTIKVLDENPERLREIEGIGAKKAARIREEWSDQRGRREAIIYLQGLGIGPGQAARIFRAWRSSCVGRIQADPYSLTSFPGIGFKRADAIARELGIQPGDPRRLQAGIVFVLGELVGEGHTCFPREGLTQQSARMLGCAEELAEGALNELVAQGALTEEASEERHVFLPELFAAEREVARQLARVRAGTEVGGTAGDGSASGPDGADGGGKLLETAVLVGGIGIALDPTQEDAVRTALQQRLTVITGGPGVGKTTVVRALVSSAEKLGMTVLLGAPTGRAAKRMEEATGWEASTLHRMLKWEPISGKFQHGADDPLKGDLFVVDETSMVDTMLMQSFLLAVPRGARIVFVGDVDQLPSVGAGEVLRDIIDSEIACVIRLHKIFRQAEGGLIIENAHRINTGQPPELPPPGELSDFYFVREEDSSRARDMILKLVTERIPTRYGLDPMTDVQVLSPMYRGACGTDSLNQALSRQLNPEGMSLTGEDEDSPRPNLRIGDRVMQTTNDYDRDIYNGDLGLLMAFDTEKRTATVTFDNREVGIDEKGLRNLVPAYAISIHKSQGSEYPAVVIPLLTEHYIMLRRRLLYTAVTRGKRLVILVGSRRALETAVRTADGADARHSRLAARIVEGSPRGI